VCEVNLIGQLSTIKIIMKYIIKVRAQALGKIFSGDEIVEVGNSWVSGNKQVRELKTGESFKHNGAWYDVVAIKQIVSRATCLV
jgi:hypothetical protein